LIKLLILKPKINKCFYEFFINDIFYTFDEILKRKYLKNTYCDIYEDIKIIESFILNSYKEFVFDLKFIKNNNSFFRKTKKYNEITLEINNLFSKKEDIKIICDFFKKNIFKEDETRTDVKSKNKKIKKIKKIKNKVNSMKNKIKIIETYYNENPSTEIFLKNKIKSIKDKMFFLKKMKNENEILNKNKNKNKNDNGNKNENMDKK